MDTYDLIELIILLELNRLCETQVDLTVKLRKNYNVDLMEKRCYELLDKFLVDYALNKTEKSD